MAGLKTFSYLRPSRSSITSSDWVLTSGEQDYPWMAALPHWDPGMTIMMRTKITIDAQAIWQECHLASGDQLRLALVWHSPGTSLRGRGDFIDIREPRSSQTHFLGANIEGTLLAEKVRFEVQLVLARRGQSTYKLSPHTAGNILWREEKTLVIQGGGSRFPTEVVDFRSIGWLPPEAGWYLEWNHRDLHARMMGGMRLLINSEHKPVFRAISGKTREDRLLREMIFFDIAKSMISGAFSNEEFSSSPNPYEDETVGANIRGLLRAHFPNESIESLAAQYKNNPSRFECDLQARFKLFQEA